MIQFNIFCLYLVSCAQLVISFYGNKAHQERHKDKFFITGGGLTNRGS
jgi:hypothetical protein